MPRLNVATSRLAARTGTRQLDALAYADAAADAAERRVRQWWQKLLALLRARLQPWQARHHLAALVPELLGDVRGNLGGALTTLARWGYTSAAQAVGQTLPLPYLRAAAGAGAALLEDDQRGDPEPVRPPLPDDEQRRRLAEILFPPLAEERIRSILDRPIAGRDWLQDLTAATRRAQPEAWVDIVAQGLAAGRTPAQIAGILTPAVQGYQADARRIARTYGMQVAHHAQMEAHAELDDITIGWQIHAQLDQHTRPEHAHRNLTIYYKQPTGAQLGLDKLPHPPLEADGSMAWNCRCWLSPVFGSVAALPASPQFETAQAHAIPDPAVYADWFAAADEKRRRIAVGTRRYSLVRDLVGSAPSWGHFVDPATGGLLSPDELRREGAEGRAVRLQKIAHVISRQRAAP